MAMDLGSKGSLKADINVTPLRKSDRSGKTN